MYKDMSKNVYDKIHEAYIKAFGWNRKICKKDADSILAYISWLEEQIDDVTQEYEKHRYSVEKLFEVK